MSLFAMMAASTGVKAQEITVTLDPGWNWISYPNAEVMDVASALSGFAPVEGDQIKSRYATSRYTRGRWGGGVTHFMPGWGYKYYSARSETVEFSFAQPSSSSVATATPTDITATSAVVGGTVTVPEGSHVFLRGVCWGTESNPDIDGDHTTESTGIGSFSSTLEGLNPNTTYYVRAYAVTDNGLAYGEELYFTTLDGGSNGHEYVDLGLPSGTMWATCNIGANAPEEYGDYFAWGETQQKDTYDWSTYLFTNGGSYGEWGEFYPYYTKYCVFDYEGRQCFYDNLTTLLPVDDAATANWGSGWRMPTEEEWQELHNNTTVTTTTQNGVNGRLFTASNGNSLFLPAAGYRNGSNLSNAGSYGYYWSSSLDIYSNWANCNVSDGDFDGVFQYERNLGQSVRPVCSSVQRPTVYTAEVTDITTNTAVCGGTINTNGNIAITARGVCWSTIHHPSIEFSQGYTTNGTDPGSFTSSITGLCAGTTYYVRAYASNSFYTIYGDEQSFTTEADGNHEYVDLGLPSGLLWATCNVGADNPEDYGDYFAWGETQSKFCYDWFNYQYSNGGSSWEYPNLTKYCDKPNNGYNGFTDDLTTLLPEDDATTVHWGSGWRMPTWEEWDELLSYTTGTWTTRNGVNGWLFTAANGNSLFLPAAGSYTDSNLDVDGGYGFYWSSSLLWGEPYFALGFEFGGPDYGVIINVERCYGQSIRPVRVELQNTVPTGAINGKFTINNNGDQVYFSQGNLQYQASTNTWKFAENQYDYVGSDNSNISSTYDGWIDLFGWGTSGYGHGANAYQPWSTSQSPSDYYAYGSASYNLYDQTGQADWGYNAISNGGSATNQWRTLTGGSGGEWDYVFNTRITTSGIRYAKAQVNNVNGVILLPDDWSESYYSLSDTNNGGAGYGSNVITASNWTSNLQSHGAVFLPAAGYRCGTSVNGGNGCYWSASYKHSLSAYDAGFSDSGLGAAASEYVGRCDGQSVRLVRVVEN